MVIDDSTKPWIYLEKMKHTEITLRVECSESERRRDWVKEVVPFEIIRWFLSKIKLKNRIGWKQRIPILDKEIPVIVQFTLVDKKCFERNGYFHDIYFGPLREYLQRANKTVFILVDFIAQLTDEFLGLVRRAANPKITFLDELWRPLDLLSVTLKAVGEFYKADKNWAPSKFEGFDLRCFLTAYWKWDIVPQYLNALLYYRSAKHLFKHIHVEHLIYPFENRCIERMLLKAIRETHPEAMTIGYQHAVLTPKHLHMFFVPGEAEITPLPDRIVTNGRWTAKLLIEEGHYPPNKIVEGVTLRFIHKQTNGLTRYSPKKSISKILVALAGGVDEYDKTFEFLDKISSLKSRQMEFRIRLHPNCPYDPFLSPKHKDKVYLKKDPVSSLYDSLEWAQVVMYTSTSVSILAMTEGIPVVWMDIMDFWGTDPIYRDDLLRWRITYPDYWENVINEIEGLTEEEFKKRWEASCKFCEEYFCFDDSKVGSLFLD